jgi:16S rRNA (cytidine1402-2'-O)-methyltransferase
VGAERVDTDAHTRAAGLPDGACLAMVATPIGNIGDMSARGVAVLRAVDVIACEDTRHTRRLLSAIGVTGARLIAVHEHNEQAAAFGIVNLLREGRRIALVSDAGTPGISDPGALVVEAVRRAGIAVVAIPGPSAFISALIISGLSTRRFVMEGFLPPKGSERRTRLAEIAGERRTVVLYEAPHRVLATIDDLLGACGPDRRISVSRELTKRFESTWLGPLADAVAAIGEPRGEYALVLEGAPGSGAGAHDVVDLDARLTALMAAGMSVRDAVGEVIAATGASRSGVYDRAVAIRNAKDAPDRA